MLLFPFRTELNWQLDFSNWTTAPFSIFPLTNKHLLVMVYTSLEIIKTFLLGERGGRKI